MPEQCPDAWGDVRCQAVLGHDSAHGAWRNGTLISWVNHGAANGRNAPSEWAVDEEDPPGR